MNNSKKIDKNMMNRAPGTYGTITKDLAVILTKSQKGVEEKLGPEKIFKEIMYENF